MFNVSNTIMLAEEVARELEISKAHAYKIIRQLNAELGKMGYITVAGNVNRQYFIERVCYREKEERG